MLTARVLPLFTTRGSEQRPRAYANSLTLEFLRNEPGEDEFGLTVRVGKNQNVTLYLSEADAEETTITLDLEEVAAMVKLMAEAHTAKVLADSPSDVLSGGVVVNAQEMADRLRGRVRAVRDELTEALNALAGEES